ncbi:hypothetical protein NHX12_009672 [Muraenolepis orangiensis]|uniref:Uncharacterized protein n=1 Tax=Muraenolepis orangiensis TaxID=630683 RepID=A0A9Q0DI23_9TELE|nr:hypothetical protein NHX12_009672 [Muraenolepis orangiensis]
MTSASSGPAPRGGGKLHDDTTPGCYWLKRSAVAGGPEPQERWQEDKAPWRKTQQAPTGGRDREQGWSITQVL